MNWVWNTKDRSIGREGLSSMEAWVQCSAPQKTRCKGTLGGRKIRSSRTSSAKKWSLTSAWFNMKSWVQSKKEYIYEYIWVYICVYVYMCTYLFRHCWFKWTLLNTATSYNHSFSKAFSKQISFIVSLLQCLIIYLPKILLTLSSNARITLKS